jgi:hypothetical protein
LHSNFPAAKILFLKKRTMPDISVFAYLVVKQTLDAWACRDFRETTLVMAPGIFYFVNVDTNITPIAASATGRSALRGRLQLMLDTFHFDAFVVEDIRVSDASPSVACFTIACFYREKTTNQRLDGCYSLVVTVGWQPNRTRRGAARQPPCRSVRKTRKIDARRRLPKRMDDRARQPAGPTSWHGKAAKHRHRNKTGSVP